MKITWLGHAGLYFENENIGIMVDPYLSDSLAPEHERNVSIDESYLLKSPKIVLITHAHRENLDVETLTRMVKNAKEPITFFAPDGAYQKLQTLGGEHNFVMLNPHSVYSECGITFYAVSAEHGDTSAVGYIIDDGKKTYYVSGGTLYNYDVLDDVVDLVEDGVDVAFLPINGRDNNMNAKDASDFAYELGAKRAVPVNYGMFDNVDPDAFDFEDREILLPYETTEM